MKKIIAALLVLCAIFSLFSCDEYIDGVISRPSGGAGSGGGANQPPMNNDPTDDFTVTVYADGQPYKPRMDMEVYWSDGFSIHTAPCYHSNRCNTLLSRITCFHINYMMIFFNSSLGPLT